MSVVAATAYVAVAQSASASGGEITSAASGRCLDVNGASRANGARVIIWDCHGQDNQRWTYSDDQELRVYDTKCLDAGRWGFRSRALTISDCNGSATQKWVIGADGTVSSAASARCMDVSGDGVTAGSGVLLRSCAATPTQAWKTGSVTTPTDPATPTDSPAPTGSPTPTDSVSPSQTPTATPSTPIVSETPTPTPTVTPTATPTPTVTPTATPTPTPTSSDACPQTGHLTYTIQKSSSPSADELDAYATLDKVLTKALAVYNCYTNITKSLWIVYDPANIPTADANINGTVRFGGDRTYMHQATVMHEIAHSVGVGTYGTWRSQIVDGLWTGSAAVAELRALTGDPTAVLHADNAHFWPYGLNYSSEVTSDNDYVIHCKIVAAMRQDMGMS